MCRTAGIATGAACLVLASSFRLRIFSFFVFAKNRENYMPLTQRGRHSWCAPDRVATVAGGPAKWRWNSNGSGLAAVAVAAFFRLLLLLLVLSLFVHFIRDALIRHEVVPDRNIACCRCANDADFVPAHRLHIINSSCDKARPRLERCGRYSTRGEGIERWRMEREYRDWVQDWVPGSSHGHLSYYERRCPLVLLSFCPGVTLSSCRCCRPRPRCCCSCYCCCYRCCCCRWRCRCPLPLLVARCCPLPAICCPTKCFVVPVARCKVCTAVWLFILASQQAAPAPTGTHWAPFKWNWEISCPKWAFNKKAARAMRQWMMKLRDTQWWQRGKSTHW